MMNVAGMNPAAAGGPVGGMMMNNGSPAMQQSLNDNTDELKLQLNTYIYEYLARSGVGDVAKLLLGKGDKFQVRIDKGSPGNRKNGEVNGVDPDAMDMDVIGDFPEDLPRPQVPAVGGKNGFLFEWYSVFSDVYFAHLKRGKMQGGAGMGQAAQYLMHAQVGGLDCHHNPIYSPVSANAANARKPAERRNDGTTRHDESSTDHRHG